MGHRATLPSASPQPAPNRRSPQSHPCPLFSSKGTAAVVLAIIVFLVSLIAVTLYVVLTYVEDTRCLRTHDLILWQEGANWSLLIACMTPGHLPSQIRLLIREQQGGILLDATPLSAFTPESWSIHHVLYEDSNPRFPDLSSGDRLLLHAPTYPVGSRFEISDGTAIYFSGELR